MRATFDGCPYFLPAKTLRTKKLKSKSLFTILVVIALTACIFTLSVCSFTAQKNDGKSHSHNYILYVIKPKCNTPGYTLCKCSCGSYFKANHKPALNHEYEDGVCLNCGILQYTKGLKFNLNADCKSYYISAYENLTDSKITIADEYNGLPVTSIGAAAFQNCSIITDMTLPNSVASINVLAFAGCENLTNVIMSVGVTKIDSYAFYGCENLKNIFYKGTAKNWAEILIDNHGNINLYGAKIYYYSDKKPMNPGNFWRYGDDGVTAVKW